MEMMGTLYIGTSKSFDMDMSWTWGQEKFSPRKNCEKKCDACDVMEGWCDVIGLSLSLSLSVLVTKK